MKRQLNENSNQLSSKDLYGMVGIVEESCKRAIDQSNPSEVEIDIDSLDLPTFLKLNKYVEDCIKVRTAPPPFTLAAAAPPHAGGSHAWPARRRARRPRIALRIASVPPPLVVAQRASKKSKQQ